MGAGPPLRVNADLVIPAEEIRTGFARSGGPGGQNVNKVASKAVLRFSVAASRALAESQRERIRAVLGSRITASGEIVIHADRHRDRARNLEDARGRLASLLARALEIPRVRRPSRPSRGAVERRLESKRRHSRLKRERKDGSE